MRGGTMSTQFVFWRTTAQLDSRAVYERLVAGDTVEGLDLLNLDDAERALIAAFPGWTLEAQRSTTGAQTVLQRSEGAGTLDVGYTPQSVTVTCYATGPNEWNLLIDAMFTQQLP